MAKKYNHNTRKTGKIRVKMHREGKCTLSGINQADLRSLLTRAMLFQLESEKKYIEKHGIPAKYNLENDTTGNAAYCHKMRCILEEAEAALMTEIKATFAPQAQPTLKEKLKANEAERQYWKKFMATIEAEA